MLDKLTLYFHTLRYLRFEQVAFRIFYLLRGRFWRLIRFKPYPHFLKIAESKISYHTSPTTQFTPSVSAPVPMFLGEKQFRFLNLTKDFGTKDIDWDFAEYGKLWTYNLNYFEFLHQKSEPVSDNNSQIITRNSELILDFVQKLPQLKTAHEPFPIALRLLFTIRFLIENNLSASQSLKISQSLFAQAYVLRGTLERHLLGNHLLENGFGLLFAAYFFEDKKLYATAKWILERELSEQVLSDGAHFELSPMYHQHMTYRVLDCLNLVKNNPSLFHAELENFLTQKAQKMLGWLEYITFKNGKIPLIADSTEGIAPTSQELFDYGKRLNLTPQYPTENKTGFYKINQFKNYECVANMGEIKATYIAGHAHSDTFGFVLNIDNKTFIVDLGISTYEKNTRRQRERASESHNSIQFENIDSTEVWGGFRVARRLKVFDKKIVENTEGVKIEAKHDGYRSNFGILHQRQFSFSEKNIEIKDSLIGEATIKKTAYLHFDSKINLILKENEILTTDLSGHTPSVQISFEGQTNIVLEKYDLPTGYNQYIESQRVCISFEGQFLKTLISFA